MIDPHADAVAALARLAEVYAAARVGLPSRRFVAAGLPVWDEECAAVWFESVQPWAGGLPGVQADQMTPGVMGAGGASGVLVVEVVRCSPQTARDDGTPPSASAETAAAGLVHRDYQLAWDAVMGATADGGRLFGTHGAVWLGWRTVGPMGGLVGSRSRFAVALGAGLRV